MRVATFAKQTGRAVSFSLAAFRQAFAAGRDALPAGYAPLRHIGGFADKLSRHLGEAKDEKSIHYLQTISSSARRMSRLIDDLLVYSRLGRSALRLQPVDLQSVAAQLAPGRRAISATRSGRITTVIRHVQRGAITMWNSACSASISSPRALTCSK